MHGLDVLAQPNHGVAQEQPADGPPEGRAEEFARMRIGAHFDRRDLGFGRCTVPERAQVLRRRLRLGSGRAEPLAHAVGDRVGRVGCQLELDFAKRLRKPAPHPHIVQGQLARDRAGVVDDLDRPARRRRTDGRPQRRRSDERREQPERGPERSVCRALAGEGDLLPSRTGPDPTGASFGSIPVRFGGGDRTPTRRASGRGCPGRPCRSACRRPAPGGAFGRRRDPPGRSPRRPGT